MNRGAVTRSDLVEASLINLRDQRAEAARWLAVEACCPTPQPRKTTRCWETPMASAASA